MQVAPPAVARPGNATQAMNLGWMESTQGSVPVSREVIVHAQIQTGVKGSDEPSIRICGKMCKSLCLHILCVCMKNEYIYKKKIICIHISTYMYPCIMYIYLHIHVCIYIHIHVFSE